MHATATGNTDTMRTCIRKGFSWPKIKKSRDEYITRLNGMYDNNLERADVPKIVGKGVLTGNNTVEVGIRTPLLLLLLLPCCIILPEPRKQQLIPGALLTHAHTTHTTHTRSHNIIICTTLPFY